MSRAIIKRMPRGLRRPVTVLVRTVDGAIADRLPGLAAEIAFWVLLSLPSLLLTAIAAFSLVGGAGDGDWQAQLIERIAEVSRVALTGPTVDDGLVPILQSLLGEAGAGLVSFGFVAAVWTASRAVKVVLITVTIVYDRPDTRKAWQTRLLGFGVTIGALVVGTILAPLLLAGPNFGETMELWFDADLGVLPGVWQVAYWPTVVVVATLALAALYHLAVPGRSRWRRDLPGAALATAVWLAGSGGLRIYGLWLADGESAYGPLAGPIVALLWLWLTGFAVLLGAELNAKIEQQWPTMDPPATRHARRTAAAAEDHPVEDRPSDPAGRHATTAVDRQATPSVDQQATSSVDRQTTSSVDGTPSTEGDAALPTPLADEATVRLSDPLGRPPERRS